MLAGRQQLYSYISIFLLALLFSCSISHRLDNEREAISFTRHCTNGGHFTSTSTSYKWRGIGPRECFEQIVKLILFSSLDKWVAKMTVIYMEELFYNVKCLKGVHKGIGSEICHCISHAEFALSYCITKQTNKRWQTITIMDKMV